MVCAGRAGAPVFFFKAPGTPVVPALALSEGMAERRAAHQPWSCPHAHSARGRLAALHRGVFTTASGRAFRADARPAAVSRLPAGTRSGPGRSPDAARGRAGEARTRAPRPSPAKQRPAERPLRGRDACEYIPRLWRQYDGRPTKSTCAGLVSIVRQSRLRAARFPRVLDRTAGRRSGRSRARPFRSRRRACAPRRRSSPDTIPIRRAP